MRKFKVVNSIGVLDIYKRIRKNGWYNIGRPLKEHEYYAIIRGINDHLAKELSEGNAITFPHRMGRLELKKQKRGAYLKDGKLKITYPVDWKETKALWERDEEAKRNKTLVRFEDGVFYKITYYRLGARYENQNFYEFVPNTFIRKALKENIKQGKVDTLW